MKMKHFYGAAVAVLLGAAPALAQNFSADPAVVKAGTYTLDPNHGKITWSVNHLGYSTYIGQFTGTSATLVLDPKDVAKSTLTATVATDSVGTLNSELDGTLKSDKFFNATKYPSATFVSTKIVKTGANTANVTGNLTMLGVTKPEVLKVTFNLSGVSPIEKVYEAGFDARTTIKRSAFGLTTFVPYIGDDVSLQIEGEFKLKS